VSYAYTRVPTPDVNESPNAVYAGAACAVPLSPIVQASAITLAIPTLSTRRPDPPMLGLLPVDARSG
jgi:hypothetical protein